MDQRRFEPSAFARLAEDLYSAGSAIDTAGQVVRFAVKELDVDHAGITVLRAGGRLETLAPTDQVAVAADELQHELNEGPCVEATWAGESVLSQHLGTDPRWPTWGPRAAGLGISSLLAVEMAAPDRRIGALNLFSDRPRQFSRDDVAFAHVFARHAALALGAAERDANLSIALDGRKLIGQAQGILMERYGVDEVRAFAILKRFSQDHNVKLRDVAAGLVETRRLPDEVLATGPNPAGDRGR